VQPFHGRTVYRHSEGARGGHAGLELCRKHGVSDASIYKWRAKFDGLDVSEAKRLKTLEDENAKLKRLLADAMLDNAALKDLLGKSGDARSKAESCRASDGSPRDERTTARQAVFTPLRGAGV
jgi:putative transposase